MHLILSDTYYTSSPKLSSLDRIRYYHLSRRIYEGREANCLKNHSHDAIMHTHLSVEYLHIER